MIIQTLVAGSLSQLWGMINGIQILVHMRVFNVWFPKNASIFTSSLIQVATFEIPIININSVREYILQQEIEDDDNGLPHIDGDANPMLSGLDELGYGDRHMGSIMGTIYIIMIATTFAVLLMILMIPLRGKFETANKIHAKLSHALLWNFLIRLIFEACIELTFVMILNDGVLKKVVEEASILDKMDYLYTMLFNFGICALPIFIIVFYNWRFDHWEDPEF